VNRDGLNTLHPCAAYGKRTSDAAALIVRAPELQEACREVVGERYYALSVCSLACTRQWLAQLPAAPAEA
jgi:hypothetical protein